MEMVRNQRKKIGRSRRLLFRVDGDTGIIGFGHVIRSLSLAKELRASGVHCDFAMKDHPEAVNRVRADRFRVFGLARRGTWQTFEPELTGLACRGKYDAVVMDLRDPHRHEAACLKRIFRRLIDIGSGRRSYATADLTIDPCRQTGAKQRRGIGKLLGGFDYVILDGRFSRYRARQPGRGPHPRMRILISMGGSDPHGVTPSVLSALKAVGRKLEIVIVVGAGYRFMASLRRAIADSPHECRLKQNVRDMAAWIRGCDAAIVAGGMVKFEAMALGVPVVTICQNRLQALHTDRAGRQGGLVNLGMYDRLSAVRLSGMLEDILGNGQKLRKMGAAGRKTVDGKGAARAAHAILRYLATASPGRGGCRCGSGC
jgi:spore coat polysaccharide biosynthesis predicted glycosyltransferase SpsG